MIGAVHRNLRTLKMFFGSIFIVFTAVYLGIAAPQSVTRARHLMGTICEIRAWGDEEGRLNQGISEAFQEITRLENILSTYRKDSEVSRLNAVRFQGPRPVSNDLWEILSLSEKISTQTNGAFDVTVQPLIEFVKSDPAEQSAKALQETRYRVGHSNIKFDSASKSIMFLSDGMSLDFGGIGKGFALDKAARVLEQRGIWQARLNFGGQLLFVGENPEDPKGIWTAVVSDPSSPETTLLTLDQVRGSVATSSQMERPHIFDPRTGEMALYQGSVTVIAETASEADAFSTALLVMGPDKGLELANALQSLHALILLPNGSTWSRRTSSQFDRFLAGRQNVLVGGESTKKINRTEPAGRHPAGPGEKRRGDSHE